MGRRWLHSYITEFAVTIHSSELLADRLALKALRAGKDVEASPVMPPKLGTFWWFRTNSVVVELAHEVHWLPAALRNFIPLNPQRDTEEPSLVIRRFADDLDCLWITLPLAV